jgi:hypothetical protein
MLTYSANLNEYGNPTIYGIEDGPNESKFVVEAGTSNILIYIPIVSETVIDKAVTELENVDTIADCLEYGLTVIFEQTEQRFKITGNIVGGGPFNWELSNGYDYFCWTDIPNRFVDSSGNLNNLPFGHNLFGSFLLFDVDNNYQGEHRLNVVLNKSVFWVEQLACENCIILSYRDGNYDVENPLDVMGLASRGIVEYQEKVGNTWTVLGSAPILPGGAVGPGNGKITAQFKKCYCNPMEDLELRAVRTVRSVPNCGGTSPVIYESISDYIIRGTTNNGYLTTDEVGADTKMTLVPLVPAITYDGSFECCVAENGRIEVKPLDLSPNVDTPHNTGPGVTLKYDFYRIEEGEPVDLLPTEIALRQFNTYSPITVTAGSKYVTTTLSTTFTDFLIVGSKIFTGVDVLIGEVKAILSGTSIELKEVAQSNYVGAWEYNKFYFPNPTKASNFFFYPTLGTYKLVATYSNNCTFVTKEYTINVCTAYLVVTGDCNNPKIQNTSSTNVLKVNVTTYNSMSVIDSVTQSVILKDFIVNANSSYQLPKLNDGFYKLTVQELSSTGVAIGDLDERILFYDCDIKSCEVALRSELLGFDFCVDCVDKKAKELEYKELERRNYMFQIQKETIYSYWDDIKYQQALPDTWNIEDHSQELQTYTETLNKLKTICKDCGFTYSTNTVPLYSTGDCGCSK